MEKRLGILLFAVSLTAISARAETEASPSYMVPVPQALASFATFNLQGLQQSTTNGTLDISFSLPMDLTGGQLVQIEFSGPLPVYGGFSAMSGPLVDASCSKQGTWNLCLIHYKPTWVSPNFDPIRSYLGSKYSGSSDLASRIQVAEKFSADPAGVLSFQN
jgi:hypothetical protein